MGFNQLLKYRNFGHRPGNGPILKRLYTFLFGQPNFLKRMQAPDIIKNLKLNGEERCFDFGCATGYITFEIAKRSKFTMGVDVKDYTELLNIPKSLEGNIEFCTVKEPPLPFEDRKFDRVLASEVLSVLENPNQYLQELKRILSDKGLLTIVFSTGRPLIQKALEEENEKIRSLRDRYPDRFPDTYRQYELELRKLFNYPGTTFPEKESMLNILKDNGFRIESQINSPSLGAGKHFEWSQFENYLQSGDPLKKHWLFPIKYFYYSLFDNEQSAWPGGHIVRATKDN